MKSDLKMVSNALVCASFINANRSVNLIVSVFMVHNYDTRKPKHNY